MKKSENHVLRRAISCAAGEPQPLHMANTVAGRRTIRLTPKMTGRARPSRPSVSPPMWWIGLSTVEVVGHGVARLVQTDLSGPGDAEPGEPSESLLFDG